ncbi:MAG: hypothetical protein AAGD35_19790 [Actinomycetota bacterium]
MTLASPPSDDEALAVEAIRMAGQRARIAQRVAGATAAAPEAPPAPEPADGGVDRIGPLGVDTVTVDHVDSVYAGDVGPELPPATVTNRNLRHYLATAMETQPGFANHQARQGVRTRLRRLLGPAGQGDYNAAVLHVLHQLDHRTRSQEHRIAVLEARLAEANRMLRRAEGVER